MNNNNVENVNVHQDQPIQMDNKVAPYQNQNYQQQQQNQQQYNPNQQQPQQTTVIIQNSEEASGACNMYCWIGFAAGFLLSFFGFFGLLCIPKPRDNQNFCKGTCIGVLISIVLYILFIVLWVVFWLNVAKDAVESTTIDWNNGTITA